MFSQRIKDLNPYTPGEQPKDRVYIKLNANENPYSPPKEVVNNVSSFLLDNPQAMTLYPDPDCEELRENIAQHLNKTGGCMNNPQPLKNKINSKMIFCGNGSDEVLSFVFYTFFDSNKPLIAPLHTYSFYPVYCGFYKIPLQTVQLNPDFSLNTDDMLKQAKENSTGMIFANPNAPTAKALTVSKIKEMLENYPKDLAFIVDEAYVDFSTESVLSLINDYENLVVIRTFSKSMAFAGMRLGYAVANEKLIEAIMVTKNSFNHFPVNAVTNFAGIAACKNTDLYIERTKEIVDTRNDFCDFLSKNNWFYYKSSTNFVLVGKKGFSGKDIYQFIKENGILVRYFNIPDISDYVRITIGSKEQMEMLKKVMTNFDKK